MPAPARPLEADVSWRAVLAPPYRLAAVVVVLGILAPAFSFFVTATVLPSVVGDIGGLALYAWASTAYAVASILGSAGSSVVVGRTGTRASLVIAAAVFGGGTVACALAPSMPVLVAGRGVQGLGGGMMIAAVHGVVREVFPEALWSRMLATISIAWGIAAMSGPAVGGAFAGIGLWRGAFWSMLALVPITAALTWSILPPPRAAPQAVSRVPFGRLGLTCAGVLCVGSVANVGGTTARVALVLGALAAMTVMLRLDARATQRLFPAGMLRLTERVGRGFWMIFFLAISTTPGTVYVPLLLQVLHGLSPAAAGYFYAGQSLAWTTAAVLSARLAGPHVRAAVVAGPLMIAAGFAGLFATIASGPVPAIGAAIVLVGAGIGTCWAHAGSIVLASARDGEGAVTASMIPSTQTFAVALGAALSGIVGNAAGLSSSAAPPVAATAGEWLFGTFLLAPLGALLVSGKLASRGDRAPAGRC
jgi:MFS family permease